MRHLLPGLVVVIAFTSIVAAVVFIRDGSQTTHVAQPAPAAKEDLQAKDMALLKDKAPDQAHAMVSVAYHYNSLWFAAEADNWPLAQFYLNETRSHMRWSVRIIPVRKDNSGREIKLHDIFGSSREYAAEESRRVDQGSRRREVRARLQGDAGSGLLFLPQGG
jgi:hypothetical protein